MLRQRRREGRHDRAACVERGRPMDWALLGSLSDDERKQVLARARRRRFARNEVIFHEGDPGDTLHLIASGRVVVRKVSPRGETITLTVLGTGEFFGELALVSSDDVGVSARSPRDLCLRPRF